MSWQKIEDATRDGGSEIVIRLKQSVSDKRPKALGRSVHQIAHWDAEGQLWWDGAILPDEYVEGFIPLPKSTV